MDWVTSSVRRLELPLAVLGAEHPVPGIPARIAEAVQRGDLRSAEIDEALFSRNLYLPDVPDPDLLIRTSAELRISNFLLWQLAYAEIVVTPVYWPAFTKAELLRCLAEYGQRTRRFGLTGEQIAAAKGEGSG